MVAPINEFRHFPITQLSSEPSTDTQIDWLWNGYLARGNLTLLTSLWKAGKTTLLAGLLRQLESGGTFLGHPCHAAKVVVVSEESKQVWASRQQVMAIGPHVQLMPRPFRTRPDPADWARLVEYAESLRNANELDLFVVDTLTSFLPGKSDSDPFTLLEFLHPLRSLGAAGVAVMVMHHPRKESSDEGSSARGSGALLGFVDVILELHRYGKLTTDECRRYLAGLSRHPETPRKLVYQWVPGTPDFQLLGDPLSKSYEENWKIVETILKQRQASATNRELMSDWPEDKLQPTPAKLYYWLQRATTEEKVVRTGQGTKNNPYRFRLPNECDQLHDFLPPLPSLPPLRWK